MSEKHYLKRGSSSSSGPAQRGLRPSVKESAFTMDTSSIKYGPGVTREVGFDMTSQPDYPGFSANEAGRQTGDGGWAPNG